MGKEITTLIENEFVGLPSWKINPPQDKVSFIAGAQKEGERELVQISRIANTEDAWVYLKEHEIWIHPITKYSADVLEDGNTLHKIKTCSFEWPKGVDGLEKQVDYHIHPWRVFSETYKSLSTGKLQSKKFLTNLFGAWLALPSGFDLKQTLLSSEDGKIASPFGITSFKLYSGNPPQLLYYVRKPTKVDAEIILKKGFGRYFNFLTDEIRKKLPDVHFDLNFERVRIKQ